MQCCYISTDNDGRPAKLASRAIVPLTAAFKQRLGNEAFGVLPQSIKQSLIRLVLSNGVSADFERCADGRCGLMTVVFHNDKIIARVWVTDGSVYPSASNAVEKWLRYHQGTLGDIESFKKECRVVVE